MAWREADNARFFEGCVMSDNAVCVVMTTVATVEEAQALAEALLAQGLAACVQFEAIRSVFVWAGEVQSAEEVRVMVKTLPACYAAVEALIVEGHAYACPQVVRLDGRGSADYAAWVRGCVQKD